MTEAKEGKIPVIKSDDFKSIYASGIMGGFNNCDFRLAFFYDSPRFGVVGMERIVLNEMILSPLTALEFSNWLTQQVKKYEATFGPIANGNPAIVQKSADNPPGYN
jgi:hypothetical protein